MRRTTIASPRAPRSLVALAAVVVMTAACAACSATEYSGGPAVTTASGTVPVVGVSPSARTSVTTSPAAAARPTSSSTPGDVAPTTKIPAGTVTDRTAARASGSGRAAVTYVRKGDFAAVVTLDCGRCSGATTVTGPGRGSPWGESSEPLSGSFLMDPLKDTSDRQTVWIEATGPWTVRISSWNTLEPRTGKQSGTGPAVIWLADKATRSTFTWKPAGEDDHLVARYFQAGKDRPYLFGDDHAFTEKLKITTPGVLSVQTNGRWTVAPGE
ncbi:hypothetical protein GCM10023221_05970 [Luteimicrobium xylanilyticum]|uniref:Lipoprotein n=1 Tax=Luteimicrobium xylanilyticum TaxID=1133546 RepID=A0A5P9QAG3_9MICO|nr:hypothetical protein [Luteimicrobium xylanilyticum]QFU98417.1 hypothetical protein KDY119_01933 [Luteimicrobium xylanilyticum]